MHGHSLSRSEATTSERLLPKIPEVEEDEASVEAAENRGCKPKLNKWHSQFKEFSLKVKAERHGVFAIKTGSALTLVSLLVFINMPHVKEIQNHAIWAILTVVLVFEFTIGATLSKGSNTAIGTLSGGFLALGTAGMAARFEGKLELIFIVFCIFVMGFMATFVKLLPAMEAYEYESKIFLLTFCYLVVQGSQNGEILEIAVSRFILIAMGGAVSLVVNICVWSVWAGQDLHRLIVKNFMKVADSIEGCGEQYLAAQELGRISSKILACQDHTEDPIYTGYRSFLASISKENTLQGFAKWEPPHGPYNLFNYPWREYIRLADSLRGCAYVAIAVHSCILSEIQASPELRQIFSAELKALSQETANVLRKVGKSLESMTCLANRDELLAAVEKAAQDLQKKIDSRSYLLVNAESWIIPRPKQVKMSRYQAIKTASLPPTATHKRSFGSVYATASHLKTLDAPLPDPKFEYSKIDIMPECEFDKPKPAKRERRKRLVSSPFKEQNFATMFQDKDNVELTSARNLSLATFALLLMELGGRLRDVVKNFQLVSQRAQFKHP